MSTKTTFKRIALVAVAALGLGVLSVAPSSATVVGLTVTAADGTATTAVSDSTTAASLSISFSRTAASDSASVTSYVSVTPVTGTTPTQLVHMGVDSATATVATTLKANSASFGAVNFGVNVQEDSQTVILGPNSAVAGRVAAKIAVFFADTTTVALVAGTYTVVSIVTPFSDGVAGTPVTATTNIVVSGVANTSLVANAANSTAIVNSGTGTSATEDASVSALSTASSTAAATIRVVLRNAANTTTARESVTATITGPGVIGNGSTFGKSVTLAYTTTELDLAVRPDGTAGSATIAISTPNVKFANKTVTFYSAAAKTVAASTNKPVISVGSNTAVVYAKAVDANGIAWGGAAYIYASSAADALVAGSVTPVACAYVASDDVHACPVSGTTAGTAKFKVIDAATVALATATSNEVSVRVSAGVPTTAKLAFDKATYAPGEKAQIWVTALDAAGLALAERTVTNIFAAGGITSSTAFSSGSDTLTATFAALAGDTSASAGTVAGYKVYTVYMPMSSGTVTISATGGTGLSAVGRVAISATADVVNSSVDAATDAANEATDAANAATDAALAAADAADAATAAAQDASDAVAALSASVSKLISSLRAQITSLTNLVIKIQKKVRA
jgi:trimeric autotransporter adhesin